MSTTSRTFEVRFQEVRAFAITIEAANAREADAVALKLFKSHPQTARLLRTDHGFFTIEDLGENLGEDLTPRNQQQ